MCVWPISDHDLYDLFAGAYGTVYRALDNLTGRYVAIKKVRIPLTDNGVSASTLREISLLKQLNTYEHANVVRWVEQYSSGCSALYLSVGAHVWYKNVCLPVCAYLGGASTQLNSLQLFFN